MEFIKAQSNTVKSRPWVNRSLAVEFGGEREDFLIWRLGGGKLEGVGGAKLRAKQK